MSYTNNQLVEKYSREQSKSKPIKYNGIIFKATFEAKFAFFLNAKCSYMYEPFLMHPYPIINGVVQYPTGNVKRYTPDFIVRKWSDNSAHIIEVKPQKYTSGEFLERQSNIAKKWIENKERDYSYHVITEKDFQLSRTKEEQFENIIASRKKLSNKIRQNKKIIKYGGETIIDKNDNRIPQDRIVQLNKKDYVKYVILGDLPNGTNSIFEKN